MKQLSKDYLVIIVSHDEEYAYMYADEVVKLSDGKIEDIIKKNEIIEVEKKDEIKERHSLPFIVALKLGLSCLKIKKVRTTLIIILFGVALGLLCLFFSTLFYNSNTYESEILNSYSEMDTLYIEKYEKISSSTYQINMNNVDKILLNSKMNINLKYGVRNYGSQSNLYKTIKNDENGVDYLSLSNIYNLIGYNEEDITNLGYEFTCGTYPTSKDEIVIPLYYYYSFLEYGYIDNSNDFISENISQEDLLGHKLQVEVIKNGSYETIDLIITGIIDTKFDYDRYSYFKSCKSDFDYNSSDYQNLIYHQSNSYKSFGYVNEELIEELTDNGESSDFLVSSFPNNQKDILNILNVLDDISDDNYNYQISTVIDYWFEILNQNILILNYFLLFIGLGLLVFSILLIYSFISFSLEEKKEEIGILRCLGVSKRDTFNIFSLEGLFIAFISVVIALIICAILIYPVNNIMIKNYITNLSPYKIHILGVLMMLAVSVITTIISMLIPLFNFNKKTPIEIVKKDL